MYSTCVCVFVCVYIYIYIWRTHLLCFCEGPPILKFDLVSFGCVHVHDLRSYVEVNNRDLPYLFLSRDFVCIFIYDYGIDLWWRANVSEELEQHHDAWAAHFKNHQQSFEVSVSFEFASNASKDEFKKQIWAFGSLSIANDVWFVVCPHCKFMQNFRLFFFSCLPCLIYFHQIRKS